MLAVGIVNELRHTPGIYGRAVPDDDSVMEWIKKAYLTSLEAGSPTTLSAVALGHADRGILGNLIDSMPAAIAGRWLYRTMLTRPTPLRRLADAPDLVVEAPAAEPATAWFGLGRRGADTPREQPVDMRRHAVREAVVIPASLLQRTYRGVRRDQTLYSLFASRRRFKSLMTADGGHVDLWVVSQSTAERHFKHFGGEHGRFTTGLHVPHPRDSQMLVPLRGFAASMLDEIHKEWVKAFEALGAKSILIADATDGEIKLKAPIPTQTPIEVELANRYGRGRLQSHTYERGVFDPARATAGARWLRDHPKIMNVIEGRVHGRQLSFQHEEWVDADFGLDLNALGAFDLGLRGKYRRRFLVHVEFHPQVNH